MYDEFGYDGYELTEEQKKQRREALAEEFMPDVEEIVKELDDGTVPEEDLMQEGYLGLAIGLNSLSEDPDSYSGMSMEETIHEAIRAQVRNALSERAEQLKDDDRLIVQVELLKDSIDRLEADLGDKPTIDEIANDMNISQEKVLDILKLAGEDTEELEKYISGSPATDKSRDMQDRFWFENDDLK